MSAYNPPTENVPIFDSSLFRQENSDTTLTISIADKRYLRFPIGQGQETIPSLVVQGQTSTNTLTTSSTSNLNGTTNITTNSVGTLGSLNVIDSATNNRMLFIPSSGGGAYNPSTISGNQSIVASGTQNTEVLELTTWSSTHSAVKVASTSVSMGAGGGNSNPNTSVVCDGTNVIIKPNIKFSGDNTIQNSAFTGAGGSAGSYTNTSITLDTNGKITAISSGVSTSSLVQVNTYTSTQTITPPANTYKMDIFVYGSGGVGGNGFNFGSYFVYGGSGAGGNMASASNISWNNSTTLSLVVNSGVNGSYTELTFGGGLGVVRCYNGGNGGNGLSSGTGSAGVKNTTANSVPSSLANWLNFYGKDGETGGSTSYPSSFIFPPQNTLGQTIKGGGITNTPQFESQIGAGQSWGVGDGGAEYGASGYGGGGCVITWYKTS